ncbi:MAG: tRNA (adenosine(37)-N6)-dimethylallyltransferase MiaA [Lachnospiraceae bacterium]
MLSNLENKPMIILAGPTGVGKTKLSIDLARQIHGAVISADSMQVYRYMDIGSAKIKKEEMKGIPHYLVDCLYPEEEFHVVRFCELAKQALKEIYSDGRIPIVVGGTGFYIQALLYDIDFHEGESDGTYRAMLENKALMPGGKEELFEQLRLVDPASCKSIHCNNVKRMIRALEFYHETGKPISEHNFEQRQRVSPYRFAFFVLTDERELLYQRIDQRVDEMMKDGLLDEVKALKERGYTKDMVSMQGLGYKELLSYLEGDCTLEDAVYTIKRDTRHFAKRQITWFKREQNVRWLNRSEYGQDENKILQSILKILKEEQIL